MKASRAPQHPDDAPLTNDENRVMIDTLMWLYERGVPQDVIRKAYATLETDPEPPTAVRTIELVERLAAKMNPRLRLVVNHDNRPHLRPNAKRVPR